MILVPTSSLRCVDKLFFSDHRASTIGTSGNFFFSLPSLSLSLYSFSSSFSLPVCFSSYPPNLLFFLFVSPSRFLNFLLFLSIFLSFIFSSISFSSFYLFYFPFGLHQSNGPKVGETSPHFPPMPLVTHIFFLIFMIFVFP